jgi:hypothetical protein
LPQKLLRENVRISPDMGPDEAKAVVGKFRQSRRYQIAIKAKFELDYVAASGDIKKENTFVYNLYRMARSSLSAADKNRVIDLLVEKEKSGGTALEAAELEFIGKAKEFVSEILESASIKVKDGKLNIWAQTLLRGEIPEASTITIRRPVQSSIATKPSTVPERMTVYELLETFGVETYTRTPIPLRKSRIEVVTDQPVKSIGTIQTEWYVKFTLPAVKISAAIIVLFSVAMFGLSSKTSVLAEPSTTKPMEVETPPIPTNALFSSQGFSQESASAVSTNLPNLKSMDATAMPGADVPDPMSATWIPNTK